MCGFLTNLIPGFHLIFQHNERLYVSMVIHELKKELLYVKLELIYIEIKFDFFVCWQKVLN